MYSLNPAAGREQRLNLPATPSHAVDERLLGRVVVVSPHLDDAVLSLGATMAHAIESGAKVEVLTVFGCEPTSSARSAWMITAALPRGSLCWFRSV